LGETAHVWLRPPAEVQARVVEVVGWEHVMEARATATPMIFLAPHIGLFELAGQYLNARIPMVALYRPPKLAALEPLMRKGRNQFGGVAHAANLAGVRAILAALKTGASLMILPDQAPQEGDGVWAPFFGHPAYTMTLAARLVEKTQAVPLILSVVRLGDGETYRFTVSPMLATLPRDREAAAIAINQAVETLVRAHPDQYQWHYNRYKHPAGAPPPPVANVRGVAS
jgi:Kdo2-lipid IVA lauroyltransferase/acyltransferase